jgi:hypothetical protein
MTIPNMPGARVDSFNPGSIETEDTGEPEIVDFPESYQEGEGKEALAETYYRDHLEAHWGF